VPWKALLSSGNMWALFWMYFTTGYGFWFFLTWMPTYLIREHGLSLETSGLYSAAPLAAGAVTSLAGGSLSDWLAVRLGSIVWGRRIVGVTAFVIAAAGFGFATQATTPGSAVALFAMSQGALDLAVPVAWATCSSVGGRYGGTATGFMNSASSVSAFVSPISGAWLSQRYGSFRPMFIVSMAIYLVGALLWFKIDPTDTIDKEQHG
jgi:nitrate/nitrite transporter NarK